MINFRLRTEFSFGEVYGPLHKVLARCAGQSHAAITDRGGTWGHVQWRKKCKAAGIKPIYGAELAVVTEEKWDEKRQDPAYVTFLATDSRSLVELYQLVTHATGQHRFRPRMRYSDIAAVSSSLEVLVGSWVDWPSWLKTGKKPRVLLSPNVPKVMLGIYTDAGLDMLPASDNFYPAPGDHSAFEIVAGDFRESSAGAMHILEPWEWEDAFPQYSGIDAQDYAARFTAELPTAEMVHFKVERTLLELCRLGAVDREIHLENEIYGARLKRELDLIAEKKFEDYFYVIADMLAFAKTKMLVGPARGSSCGSLVCFLLGITEIDPIPHNLLFERFIDINRQDLPDIDIDFPDTKRDLVFDYMRSKYGAECVVRLGTIGKFKAKSSIGDVAKALSIPQWEVQDLKNSIIERSTGDSRAAFCIADTFEQLDVGKNLVAKYPGLRLAAEIEAHASHAGQHAAGIVVTAEPVNHYCSVDLRTGAAQVDKYDAEQLNLLKIDALGLRTLSVIEDCLEQIGWSYDQIIRYPLTDNAAFDVINRKRFAGVFQFEGLALQSLCNQMQVERFEDISALTALARPGPLSSGGTGEWLKRRTGKSEVKALHPLIEHITSDTHGVVCFQEQVLLIGREFGGLSWEDVSSLRKAMSKSLGKEFFDTYWVKFKAGTDAKGVPEDQARHVWDHVNSHGSWSFNKCISGDTKITLARQQSDGTKTITIKDLYRLRRRKFSVSSLQPDGKIRTQKISDVHCNGKKECYRYYFTGSRSVVCTPDHKFIINGRWQAIKSARPGDIVLCEGKYVRPVWQQGPRPEGLRKGMYYSAGSKNPTFKTGKVCYRDRFIELHRNYPCKDCGAKNKRMEAHHNDFSRGTVRPNDLAWLCPACHKARHDRHGRNNKNSIGKNTAIAEFIKSKYVGMRDTYDLEVPEVHNFVLSNGLITHNSHAVAYGVLSYWCCVLKAHHPLEYAAACLRHAKDDDQSIKLLRELHKEGYKYKAFDPELSRFTWRVVDGQLIGGLTGVRGIGEKTARDIEARREAGQELTGGQKKKLANAVTPYDTVFECRERWGHIIANPAQHNIASPITEIASITNESEGGLLVIGKLIEKNLRDHNELINLQKRGGKKIIGQNLFLNVTLEDDTGSITCGVNRHDYLRIGKPIVEEGKIGDWYLIKGNARRGFRRLNVERVRKLS